MNRITKIIMTCAIALGLTLTAAAQQWGLETIYDSGWGRWLPTVSVTNLTDAQGVINCTDYHQLLVCVGAVATNGTSSFGGFLTNSTALVVAIAPMSSGEGTRVDTNRISYFGVFGATNVALGRADGCTNMEVGAWPYLKVLYISNSLLNISYSNVTIKVSGKPRQREYR